MRTQEKIVSKDEASFVTISPKVLYFGTPGALISSVNEDGSANLAPIFFSGHQAGP
jgi:hypothetical protein